MGLYSASMGKQSSFSAVAKAVHIVGSQSELARRLGVKQGHVWAWINKTGAPAEYCLDIEKETGGKVTRYQLRPDVFGTPNQAA